MADMRAHPPKLRAAKEHVEGRIDVGFDRTLPWSATLTVEGSYDVEHAGFGESGKVRRSITVRESL